nr:MAG TPA: hypothetical protein [Caudoviricetes sp.]
MSRMRQHTTQKTKEIFYPGKYSTEKRRAQCL